MSREKYEAMTKDQLIDLLLYIDEIAEKTLKKQDEIISVLEDIGAKHGVKYGE